MAQSIPVLPIDKHLEVIAAAAEKGNVVVEAAPGAGKTTRVPVALLARGGPVLVLEPRRIAARMAARRVAQELGVRLGAEVGYQVRFEEAAGKDTRLRFVTEGVLTRRLLSDPQLQGVTTVVLDEFHERHLDTDLAVALLRRLQKTSRPDLRIVVMSATLDAEPVAQFLGGAARVVSEGRLFPIEVEYTPASSQTLDEQVARALERLFPLDGDVLVFLPGAAEIRAAQRACEPLARNYGFAIFPLYGDLSPEEQDAAVQPLADGRKKVILSTNIAESSITIDGISAVIDSGLARIASDSPWTGLPTLRVSRISRASAIQRAGRAGRTRAGRVIRLYSQEDFLRRPEFDAPELARRELSQLVLDLRAMGIGSDLEWFHEPPAEAWKAAETLLTRLGATGDTARAMSRMPLHPRLSRLVVEAERRGCGLQGCEVAACLSSGERRLLMHRRDRMPTTSRTFEQLSRFIRNKGRDNDEALGLSLLAAFPDRLAKRLRDRELALAGGGSAVLAEESHARFLLAVDIEDRKEKGAPIVRIAHKVEPEWLIELFPERIEERNGVEWNRTAERVETVSALLYDGIVIEETRGGELPDPGVATAMLAAKAREADTGRFVRDREALDQLLARAAFAHERGKIAHPFGIDEVKDVLAELCWGKRSFKELESEDVLAIIEAKLRLEEFAPTRLALPSGRRAKVEYAPGQAPWVSSRLQDFFGMKESPRISGVPLVVHLLAPSQRPVQVTSDLAGFWERHYPQIRRELMRKYPKHQWPEKP